ncbi:hypothetical protein M3Y97_00799200 [Aphelenchoides bicaudatus]|nr:hypothetical protein M3Y97_00799200 [Aphelenchoides bicaudatus]
MYLNYLFLILLQLFAVNARKAAQKPFYGDVQCDNERSEGDCNVQECVKAKLGLACEARFVRFAIHGKQFSRKTCRCISEPVCTPIELGQLGCTTYKNMSRQTQRSVRRWTMSEAEKNAPQTQYGNEYKNASSNDGTFYSDHERHLQLLNGTTKFCCRIDKSATHQRFSFQGKRPVNNRKNSASNSLSSVGLLLVLTFCF